MPHGPGSRLADYEMVRTLGTGGMGEVWLATELRLGRKVALKLLPADLTRDPDQVQRFEQEARAASALSHPNVCTILALGETTDGQHYIAMEYVEGETLRQRLSTARLSIREALDISIQIAAALSAAHGAGIVHRDIKPENVMLRPDGFVKVLDFGLAKLAPASPDSMGADSTRTVLKTDAGTVVGTAAYMSPEQARGQEVDARTDIWSLGVMLYEMVAGRSPFAGPSGTDVLAAILDREPAPLARFEPDTPSELQRIVTKALRKDRGQRYQTVHDLLLDLQALGRDLQAQSGDSRTVQPGASGPVNAPVSGSTRAFTTTHRRASGVASVVLALAVVGTALWWWAHARAVPEQESNPLFRIGQMTRLTAEGDAHMAALSGDGRYVVYVRSVDGRPSLWVRQTETASNVQIVPAAGVEYIGVSFSPDASRIYYVTRDIGGEFGTLFRVPLLGGKPQRLLGGTAVQHDDGTVRGMLRYCRRTQVLSIRLPTSPPHRIPLFPTCRYGWQARRAGQVLGSWIRGTLYQIFG